MAAQSAPAPVSAEKESKPLQEERRKAIDLVATLRARALRVGLFGTLLIRPDPDGVTSEGETKNYLEGLETEVGMMVMVGRTLTAAGPLPDTDQRICKWISAIAQGMPGELRDILEVLRLSETVLASLQSNATSVPTDLKRQMDTTAGSFFASVTALCDALWHDLYASQAKDLEQATTAALSLNKRLERLESIGKHVRLVSLNASVEAARIGETGQGVMVIAREFKSLAEEIQSLARDAHTDVNLIS